MLPTKDLLIVFFNKLLLILVLQKKSLYMSQPRSCLNKLLLLLYTFLHAQKVLKYFFSAPAAYGVTMCIFQSNRTKFWYIVSCRCI